MSRIVAFALLAVACGRKAKPYKVTGQQAAGVTACGGGLTLGAAGASEPSTGKLEVKAAVASIERQEHGIRIALADGNSFTMSLDNSLEPPVKAGDALDVSIECAVVGWNATECAGTVARDGTLVAFDRDPGSGWTIKRGPLLERDPHPNYGPMEVYGIMFSYGGASATTPLTGCSDLRTPAGVYRVSGRDVDHQPPLAPDSADYRYFSVVRLP